MTIWGFSNTPQMLVEVRRDHSFRKSQKVYYISVSNLRGQRVGGVNLQILKRRKAERNHLFFKAPRLSTGLDEIRTYFEKHLVTGE